MNYICSRLFIAPDEIDCHKSSPCRNDQRDGNNKCNKKIETESPDPCGHAK